MLNSIRSLVLSQCTVKDEIAENGECVLDYLNFKER